MNFPYTGVPPPSGHEQYVHVEDQPKKDFHHESYSSVINPCDPCDTLLLLKNREEEWGQSAKNILNS